MEKPPVHPCEQVGLAKWICSNLFMCFRLQGWRSLAAYASMIYGIFLSLSCHQCLHTYLNRLFAGLRTPDETRLCFPLVVLTRLSARPQCDGSWRGKWHPSVHPRHRHVHEWFGNLASVSQPGPEPAPGGHGSSQRRLWCRGTRGFFSLLTNTSPPFCRSFSSALWASSTPR